MSANSEVQGGGPFDTVKLALAGLLLLAGIVFYYYFASVPYKLAFGYRLGGLFAGIIIALLVAYQTQIGRFTWHFLLGSRMEVRKMVWPTRQETMQTTIAVIVMTILLGIFLWLLDLLFFWLLNGVTGQGG